ncbi:LacI family DNA-binding transcriptional regulator [Oryzobacter telluris]|uniref:LacI family DNA-binding transcriptional regulator n=1 Tax=Oryzobacter telluris TaxID=3149179 RepID=UPI00370D28D1
MAARPTPRRPRIVDVAKAAGVSPQTVSNVINDRGGFTPPTRAKVERAIAALGFQPNRYAQSLRSQRTGLIGFDMVRRQLDVSNPFTVGLLHALVPAATHHNRRVLVFTHDEEQPDEFRTTAVAGLVDGFILSDSTAGDIRARVLEELGVPFVVMGRPETGSTVAALDIDNAVAMHEAVDHVVDQGCRDIAFVGYGTSAHWNTERRRGTREALSQRGIQLPRHRVLSGTTLKSIRTRLPEFLTHNGVPDAVITSSDSLAVSVVAIASMLGIRVGKDLAVTGFDDSPLASMVSPEITSVSVPVEPIAERLLDLLELVMDGQPVPEGDVIGTRLVVRGSSGFAPRRDR